MSTVVNHSIHSPVLEDQSALATRVNAVPFATLNPARRTAFAKRLPTHYPGNTAYAQYPTRVACHRGDWRNFVENTLEAVESCLDMGADIVEVDIWRTKDGRFILMHDDTLNRCSSGDGLIRDHTFEEIQKLRLKDGLSNMTDFHIPTLEQVLQLCRARGAILNLDKADLYLDEILPIVREAEMLEHVIVKSETPYAQLVDKFGAAVMREFIFMPIINVTAKTTKEYIAEEFRWRPFACEVNFETENYPELLEYIKTLASQDEVVLWINTIWPTTCGGHNDDRALKEKDATWGYIVTHIGAGIIQTDRPAMLLSYLKQNGYHP